MRFPKKLIIIPGISIGIILVFLLFSKLSLHGYGGSPNEFYIDPENQILYIFDKGRKQSVEGPVVFNPFVSTKEAIWVIDMNSRKLKKVIKIREGERPIELSQFPLQSSVPKREVVSSGGLRYSSDFEWRRERGKVNYYGQIFIKDESGKLIKKLEFPDKIFYQIYADNVGNLMYIMRGQKSISEGIPDPKKDFGLYVFDPKTETIIDTITLPSLGITSIETTGSHTFILANLTGLEGLEGNGAVFKYDPQEKKIEEVYRTHHYSGGIIHNEILYHGISSDLTGKRSAKVIIYDLKKDKELAQINPGIGPTPTIAIPRLLLSYIINIPALIIFMIFNPLSSMFR